jgi:AraC-like DNA-binding protein
MHGCLQAPLKLHTDQKTVAMDAGNFCFIPPGVSHHWSNSGHHTAATVAVLVDTANPGRWPARTGILQACSDLERLVTVVQHHKLAGDAAMQHAFWQVTDQLTAEHPRRELDIVSRLLTFFSLALERLEPARALVGATGDVVHQIRRLLLSRVNDKLTIAEVARHVHVSATRAKDEFRKTYGCGIMAYFNELKIWQAKRRLCDPTLTVEQIGRLLGFSSPGYFSRSFQRHTGETPSEFRAKGSAT